MGNLTITEPPKMFGAYVTSISSSVGYGASSSTLQMTLVEDSGAKDAAGNAAPVEVTFPLVGTACQFIFKEFKFAGIFQRYTKKQGTGGTTFDVVFESPAKVLDGVQVILDVFEGTSFNGNNPLLTAVSAPNFTSQMDNILNPFGVLENYAFGGQFGSADVNSAGFPAKQALELIESITRSEHVFSAPDVDPEDVTALGGTPGSAHWVPPVYPDPNSSVNEDGEELIGGPIHFGETKYVMDFGDLTNKIPDFFRIKGPVQNINAILQECCDIIIHDYIISIDPVSTRELVGYDDAPTGFGGVGGTGQIPVYEDVYVNGPIPIERDDEGRVTGPIIKVTIIDKSEAPNPGVVEALVESYKASGKLISADNGKELSSNVTQKLILGGPANRNWETPMNYLIPVWGKDQLGNYSLGRGYEMEDEVVTFLDDGRKYYANVLEVRCAASGQECWDLYYNLLKPHTNYPDNFSSIGLSQNMLNGITTGRIPPNMLLNTSGAVAANLAQQGRGVNLLDDNNRRMAFDAMQRCAQDYWGKQFMVMLPVEPGGIDNNIKFVSEDYKWVTAWDMAESAWNEWFQAKDIMAYDGDGKMKAIAAYYITNNRDYSNLEGEGFTYITKDHYKTIGTTKVEIDKEIYWLNNVGTYWDDPDNPFDDVTAMCHVTVPQVLSYDSLASESNALTKLILGCFHNLQVGDQANFQQAFGVRGHQQCHSSDANPMWSLSGYARGAESGYFSYGYNQAFTKMWPKAVRPWSISLPQQSNRYVWGPWYLFTQKNGKAEVSVEANLVPSTFGSIAKMDEAAFALAYAGTANLYASESGYVELAEFPAYNIADRFGGSGPYVTNIDVNIGTSGCKTNYKFNTWTRNFGKLAKYNIDRISRINKNTIRFLQEQRNKWGNLPNLASTTTNISRSRSGVLGQRGGGVGGIFGSLIPLGAGMNLGAAQAQPDIPSIWTNVQAMDIVAAQNFHGQLPDANFGMSMEQLYSPIAIDKDLKDTVTKGDQLPQELDKLPGFTVALDPNNDNEGGTFGLKHMGPTNRDLDPYFNFSVNDFEIVMHTDKSYPFDKIDVNVKKKNAVSNPTGFKFLAGLVKQTRTFGLRGPLLLSGWGYDVCDLPVPSKGDGAKYDADSEIFGKPIAPTWVGKFKFEPEIPTFNRGNWKSGPLHVMWDEERKVWAGGLQIVEGVITQNITKPADPETPTEFTAKIRRHVKKYDDDGKPEVDGDGKQETGWEDLGEEITILNRDPTLELDLGNANTDLYVMAIRINYEWRPLWVSCDPTL